MITDPFVAFTQLTNTILFLSKKVEELRNLRDMAGLQQISREEFLERYNEMQKSLASVEEAWDKAVAARRKRDEPI